MQAAVPPAGTTSMHPPTGPLGGSGGEPAVGTEEGAANAEAKDPRSEAKEAREALKKEWDEAVRKTKPRDTAAGLKSGIATAAAGVASGVVGLFAAPIVGAQQEGAAGFAKGLATGGTR